MRLDSSGNLGLGVTPSAWKSTWRSLDVGTAASFYSQDNNTTGIGSNLYFSGTNWYRKNTGATALYQLSEGVHYWYSNGSAAAGSTFTPGSTMTLDSSGNLGIGVTPSAWSAYKVLQLPSNSFIAFSGGFGAINQNAYYNGGYKYIITDFASQYYQQQGGHFWTTAASGTAGNAITFTQAMTLDASGQLGIGTTNPVYKLVVSNSGAQGFEVDPVTGINGGINLLAYDRAGGAYKTMSLFAADTRFYTGSGESARFDSSGNLLVGCTSLPASNRTKGFGARNNTTGGFQVYQNSSQSDWAISISSGSICNFYSDNGSALVLSGQITVNGNTTSYTSVSDYRLKTLVAPVTDAGARIDALEPVEFEWNESKQRARGFFAHKFQEVYPGSVTGSKDAVDEDGKPIYQSMQAGTSEVIADLVAELQSLRKRVAQLEKGN